MAKPAPTTAATTRPKKARRKVNDGIVHIQASFNNTIITVTDRQGNVLDASSAGANGFKGSRKCTPFAAQQAAEVVINRVKEACGFINAEVRVKGPGAGRESAIRAIAAAGVKVFNIIDVTPLAHNGCRPRKERRI